MDDTTKAELCALLGVPAEEVHSFEDHDAGPIVTTTDMQRYIVVHPDRPDAHGKHGVMFLTAPHENYVGTFPVFAQPGAVDTGLDLDVDLVDDAGDVGDLDGDGVPDGPIREVLEWVAGDPGRAELATAAEEGRDSPRATLLAELAAIAKADS
jgi:hypothetical protein